MNVLMLLTAKEDVSFLSEDSSLRQGLEKMKAHGYSAIPVLSTAGHYLGSISEGDFLWAMYDKDDFSKKELEHIYIKDILREDFNPPVRIDVSINELMERATKQNFIPVVDDRNFFIGIITRQDIIKSVSKYVREAESQKEAKRQADLLSLQLNYSL
ncbi:MAG: CBS domain-containing protein [Lachnospiraceae bacterium]|nr:CBS domain-containing protein [Lachnospiraceae bacterium]